MQKSMFSRLGRSVSFSSCCFLALELPKKYLEENSDRVKTHPHLDWGTRELKYR